ncbi:hypothetical protein KCU64_g14833, partial [Aureobasidium melanogenum]
MANVWSFVKDLIIIDPPTTHHQSIFYILSLGRIAIFVMKFTTIALAGLATVAMASPAAEANPAPQPEAAADPAFSSWGKKYNPHLWNGWGDAPGQVY